LVLAYLWTIHCSIYPCVNNPQNPNCTDFYYPDSLSKGYTNEMCPKNTNPMKMSVCDLLLLCNSTGTNVGIYCSWFSLYKEGCNEMPMGYCTDLSDMCTNTFVHQCNTSILDLPNWSLMQQNNTAMCKNMPGMTGCLCDSCSVLEQYGELCKEMGGGEGCEAWEIFCQKIPDWSICTNTPGNVIGEMKMYFHWGYSDYILFESWVPYSALTYGISVIAVFFIALLHEGYRVLKINVETRLKLKSKYERIPSNSVNTKPLSLGYLPLDWQRDIFQAVYKTIDVALHYLIMLIAMTFNGGLFIAVVLGYGVGHLFFTRLAKPKHSQNSVIEVEEENCH